MDLSYKYFLPQQLCLPALPFLPAAQTSNLITVIVRGYRGHHIASLAFATGSPQGTTTLHFALICHVIVMMCVKLIGCALSEGILRRQPVNAGWLVRDWWAVQGPWDALSVGAAVENNAWSIAVTDEALCLPDIWRGTRLNAGDHLLSVRGGWLDASENSVFLGETHPMNPNDLIRHC